MLRFAAFAAAIGLTALALLPSTPAVSQAATLTTEQTQLFENRIRPVLYEACVNCHGKDVKLGNLRLDLPLTAAQAQSVLQRVKSTDPKIRMPQGAAPLAPEKIAALEAWVKAGAPWPQGVTVTSASRARLWSLEPVRKPTPPPVKFKAWPRNPIDPFVLAKVEGAGLKPAPYADRRNLIRRASYELTGLPPTPDEVEAFLADKSPDAWPKVVDRLLASPHYGERMARFWMDIARYADTKGYVFTDDRNYYHAYTYRDWLIQSFNADLPYDAFVQYQLAADRMEIGEERRHLAALGFLTLGRRFINNIHDILDDRIDVTMRGLQGLTVACARCHDHKFDPVLARDYYSLYAVFASSQENQPIISEKAVREPYEKHDAQFQAAKREEEETVRAEIRRLRDTVKAGTASPELQKTLQGFRENELPNADQRKALLPSFDPAKRERIAVLVTTMDTLKKSYPPTPEFAHAMSEGAPHAGVIFKRGNPGTPGEPAPRRFLSCIAGESQPEWTTGGRLELAKAITDKSNPLTARVLVNRLWLLHFGNGIVRTPSDFGRQGEKPSHPELLDYLADTFMNEDNWSLKKVQRRMLLSATWMQSCDVSDAVFQKDPDNRLFTRQNRRRLDMEQLRDSVLWASGALQMSRIGGKSEELWMGNYTKRRAVYGFIERQNLPGIFKTLDFATPDVSSPQRFKTTVPQQALFMLNSPLVSDQARALVQLPEVTGAKDDAAKIKALYRRLFDRAPSADELKLAQNYVAAPDKAALRPDTTTALWRYGWGKVADGTGRAGEFHDLTTFVENQWRGGTVLPDPILGWVLLNKDGGHPGNPDHAVIRRWTSPIDGTVRLSGRLNHPGEVGDGVRARVVHSRTGILGEWVAQHSATETVLETVEVKRGDTLDFVVDCRANENTDAFQWAPAVVQTGAKKLSWRADRDFSGPPPAPAAPLTKWERFAQALLMTNEFLYID